MHHVRLRQVNAYLFRFDPSLFVFGEASENALDAEHGPRVTYHAAANPKEETILSLEMNPFRIFPNRSDAARREGRRLAGKCQNEVFLRLEAVMDEANNTEPIRHYVDAKYARGKTEEENLIDDDMSPEMKLSSDETGN